jgi:hypothetical protein
MSHLCSLIGPSVRCYFRINERPQSLMGPGVQAFLFAVRCYLGKVVEIIGPRDPRTGAPTRLMGERGPEGPRGLY